MESSNKSLFLVDSLTVYSQVLFAGVLWEHAFHICVEFFNDFPSTLRDLDFLVRPILERSGSPIGLKSKV